MSPLHLVALQLFAAVATAGVPLAPVAPANLPNGALQGGSVLFAPSTNAPVVPLPYGYRSPVQAGPPNNLDPFYLPEYDRNEWMSDEEVDKFLASLDSEEHKDNFEVANSAANRRLLQDSPPDTPSFSGHDGRRYFGEPFKNGGCTGYRDCDGFYAPYHGKITEVEKPNFLPAQYDWASARSNQVWNIYASSNEKILRSPESGGKRGGKAFDDMRNLPSKAHLTKIRVLGGKDVHGIHLTYADGSSIVHGSRDADKFQTISLADDEHIVAATFRECRRRIPGTLRTRMQICSAGFITNKGQTVSFGEWKDDFKNYLTTIAPKSYKIHGLFGSNGALVDRAGTVAFKV